MPGPRWKEALFVLPPDALERELGRLDCILDELHELRDEAERRLQEQRRPKLRLGGPQLHPRERADPGT